MNLVIAVMINHEGQVRISWDEDGEPKLTEMKLVSWLAMKSIFTKAGFAVLDHTAEGPAFFRKLEELLG